MSLPEIISGKEETSKKDAIRMRLSKRLETIIDMAYCWISLQEKEEKQGLCVADVGTDHGFVPICLIERGIVGRVLALDIRKGPLLRAREHVQNQGLQERIALRLGDGLKPLKPGEAQLVIMTGMGGELMLRILKESPQIRETVRCWIFSPQSELSWFRYGLKELGLAIRDEVMLQEDGKYYVIMKAEPGEMYYSEEYQYRYGEQLIRKKSQVLAEYLEQEIQKFQKIREQIQKTARAETVGAKERLQEVEEEIEQAKKVRELLGKTI